MTGLIEIVLVAVLGPLELSGLADDVQAVKRTAPVFPGV